ncbi:response regulator transcription factor [Variovorax sp. LT1R16]|uniref:response regulator transcription factor n=1 Tax=Variovorax sp. LT1R16 TaxID=3443728 RepID=UPI003F4772B8
MNAVDTNEIHVIVDHPDPLLAMGLAAALGRKDRIHVHVGSMETAPAGADVAISNYDHGLRLAADNRAAMRQRPRVMVLAQQGREQEVRHALECGVHAYLMNGCRMEELFEGVLALVQGRRYMCTAAAQRVADSMAHETLTSRESEVLELLVGGCCNKTIARQLDIAVGTVKAHMKGIMAKLDASSRTQAVSVAVARGLVGSPQSNETGLVAVSLRH